MKNPWHLVVDSEAFRWLVKRGPTRRLFRSSAFRKANVRRNAIRASLAARRDPHRFDHVRTFCFFVGHNKSGTSMLGGLLDAHRQVILADEADALQYVAADLRREQIFHVLGRSSEVEARKGRVTARRLQPYSFAVAGQWQGRSDAPLVVGDSTVGTTTRRLGEAPGLLDRTRTTMSSVELKVIHVIRNPFDPISLMMVRSGRSLESSVSNYFEACEHLLAIRNELGSESLLPVYHERFLANPKVELARVCEFLGVDADNDYLRACAAIIRPEPDRSRQAVAWTESWIAEVERHIEKFDFLSGYSYDD